MLQSCMACRTWSDGEDIYDPGDQNLDPSLARTPEGGGQRFMQPNDRPAGGGEPSSQAFRASRMLVEIRAPNSAIRYGCEAVI